MRPFKASLSTVVSRFFLMMAVVIIGGFTGQLWLIVFALPIFLTAMLAISFSPETTAAKSAKISTPQSQNKKQVA